MSAQANLRIAIQFSGYLPQRILTEDPTFDRSAQGLFHDPAAEMLFRVIPLAPIWQAAPSVRRWPIGLCSVLNLLCFWWNLCVVSPYAYRKAAVFRPSYADGLACRNQPSYFLQGRLSRRFNSAAGW